MMEKRYVMSRIRSVPFLWDLKLIILGQGSIHDERGNNFRRGSKSHLGISADLGHKLIKL